ncbi:hypothetical protein EPI10_001641 [Gossypium australe]|uniref:Uncharacterized protein n=1 Tax=Gossypium australe TaxID=47621 RepID=A0A5B6VBP0_9ROSI|nr:hypothetical protein EPI10_001641 [Gossypium australe]
MRQSVKFKAKIDQLLQALQTNNNSKRDCKEHVKAITFRTRTVVHKFEVLDVNLPLLEFLDKMPKFAKFLRKIMFRHKRIGKGEKITVNAECSAVVARKNMPKLKDTRCFTMAMEIRGVNFGKALCSLGSSIILFPFSLVHSKGVLEDVLVKVHQFILHVDFIILDFQEDLEIPIMLGSLFLATSESIIDVEKVSLTMRIDGEVGVFKCVNIFPNVMNSSSSSSSSSSCHSIGSMLLHVPDKFYQGCCKWYGFLGKALRS